MATEEKIADALLAKVSANMAAQDAVIVTLMDSNEPEAIDTVTITIPRKTYDAMIFELKRYKAFVSALGYQSRLIGVNHVLEMVSETVEG